MAQGLWLESLTSRNIWLPGRLLAHIWLDLRTRKEMLGFSAYFPFFIFFSLGLQSTESRMGRHPLLNLTRNAFIH